MLTKLFLLLLTCMTVLQTPASAAWDPVNVVPTGQRERFRNPDGSCVQCSIGMMGVDLNNASAEMLLWDSEHGPAVRGGSWPERTREYCAQRNIDAWHIEGDTLPWIEWALRTGRSAAVTLTPAHMQWVCGMSADGQTFFVVDNNSPQRVDSWTRARFIEQHRIHGGGWAVILKGPARVPWVAPSFVPWWQSKQKVQHNDPLPVSNAADLFGRR